MLAFNKLENRYIISGTIHFDSAVHIGSGLGDETTDALFVRSNSKLYLPGSSVRGALRSIIERLATTLVKDEDIGKIACSLDASSESFCLSCNKDSEKKLKEWREKQVPEQKILERIESKGMLCRVCRLFGSPYLASKVKVNDCFLSNGETTPESQIRIGIGIDRDTGSVKKGVLHDREVLESGPEFKMEIMGENLDDSEPCDWGLLSLALLEMMREGEAGQFCLGARSASGMGKCHLKQTSLVIEGFAGPEELISFLDTGTYAQKYNQQTTMKAVDFLTGKRSVFLDRRDSLFEQALPPDPKNKGD